MFIKKRKNTSLDRSWVSTCGLSNGNLVTKQACEREKLEKAKEN